MMIKMIPVGKVKILAEQVSHTVHAGTEVEDMLITFLDIAKKHDMNDADDIPVITGLRLPVSEKIWELFEFYDAVGMLDE